MDEEHDRYVAYHDGEWGVAVHDDRTLFEFLLLEGAQAGLSWATILKKRENYRLAFEGYDPQKIAVYGKRQIQKLLKNEGIVLQPAQSGKRRWQRPSLSRHPGRVRLLRPLRVGIRRWITDPERVEETRRRAREDNRVGDDEPGSQEKRFQVCWGPTICYAFMQATGMVNDHTTDCFRYKEVAALS